MKPTNILCRLFPAWFRPSWDECTTASLWDGGNAERRMMNTLSPRMSDGKFRDYLDWQKHRGCNTAHVFVANQADGEHAGYSIYCGLTGTAIDQQSVKVMIARVKAYRRAGMCVVLWLMADDSGALNKALLADPGRYMRDLKATGLLRYASMVCLGLELSEYIGGGGAGALRDLLREVWSGAVATHDVSGSLRYAPYGDVVFGQVKPTASDSEMLRFAALLKATGRPGGIIECDRHPNRERCQKLIDAGLPFVGNW
jgi:hypothetical protein